MARPGRLARVNHAVPRIASGPRVRPRLAHSGGGAPDPSTNLAALARRSSPRERVCERTSMQRELASEPLKCSASCRCTSRAAWRAEHLMIDEAGDVVACATTPAARATACTTSRAVDVPACKPLLPAFGGRPQPARRGAAQVVPPASGRTCRCSTWEPGRASSGSCCGSRLRRSRHDLSRPERPST